MKTIRNDSIQGFELYLNTPKGKEIKFLKPKQTVIVPEGYISTQIKTLHKRRHLTIKNC